MLDQTTLGASIDRPEFGRSIDIKRRPYVARHVLMSGLGMPLYLIGTSFGPTWNITSGTPGGNQAKEEQIARVSRDGCNLIHMQINLKLWSDNTYDNAQYKSNVEAWVDWFVDYDMYFIVKLQNCKFEASDVYSASGSNYKIAENEPWRTRAIDMFKDMATLWKNLPNFLGISPLCEPYSGTDYDHWDNIRDFYLDCIDDVRKIDPNCLFFIQSGRKWGSAESTANWKSRGYITRSSVVYEYHSYYDTVHVNSEWGVYYRDGDRFAGRQALSDFLNKYLMPIIHDGHPILLGEFGIRLDDTGNPDANLWREAYADQVDANEAREFHYAHWRNYIRRNTSHRWGMFDTDLSFNPNGVAWQEEVVGGMGKP